jgi:hypothetical protein
MAIGDNPEKIIKLLEGIQNIESYIKYQNLKKDAVYYSYIEKISISIKIKICMFKIPYRLFYLFFDCYLFFFHIWQVFF